MKLAKQPRTALTIVTTSPAASARPALDLARIDALVAAFGDRVRIVVTPRAATARDVAELLHPWDVTDLVTGAIGPEPLDEVPLSVSALVTRLGKRLGVGWRTDDDGEARDLDHATLTALHERAGLRVVLLPASMNADQRTSYLEHLDVTVWCSGEDARLTVAERVDASVRWI